jgi:hypothetical protein
MAGETKAVIWALLAFVVAANTFAVLFVHQEHFLYFWDFTNYWSKFST